MGCVAAQVALGEALHPPSILLLYIYINVLRLLKLLCNICVLTLLFFVFFFKTKLQGCAAAQVALGEALRDGSCGAEKDPFKARSLFQLAAQQAKKKKVLYVSSYYYVYVCTHVSSYYYIYLRSHMCPHTTAYVCVLICVLILVHICVLICVLILVQSLHMCVCSHTPITYANVCCVCRALQTLRMHICVLSYSYCIC